MNALVLTRTDALRSPKASIALVLSMLSAAVLAAFAYSDYLAALGSRESGNHPGSVNRYGYLGLYQMGESALVDAGYYVQDSTPDLNDWQGQWTGKQGIHSKADFLANAAQQTQAITDYNSVQWGYIKALGLDQYVGQDIGGVLLTESGLLAGAHLVGVGGLKTFLASHGGSVPGDANQVLVTDYIGQFNGYDIALITGNTTASGLGYAPLVVDPSAPLSLQGLTPSLGGVYEDFSIAPSSAYQSGTGGISQAETLYAIQSVMAMLLLIWMAYVTWGQFRLWSTGMQSLFGMQSNVIKTAVISMLLLMLLMS